MNQFLRFCALGAIGFVVDAGVLQLLTMGGLLNDYSARVVSFAAAASTTWILNRRFTFRATRAPSRAEWLRYVGLMAGGAVVNYGVYALGLHWVPLAATRLWLAVAAGSVAGLGVNFMLSRLLSDRAQAASLP